jgi:hypothetical protein
MIELKNREYCNARTPNCLAGNEKNIRREGGK